MNFGNRKTILFGIIIINLLGVWAFYDMFYGRENSFDYSKKALITSSEVKVIETDQGTWKVNDSIFDFYHDYRVRLDNRKDRILLQNYPEF